MRSSSILHPVVTFPHPKQSPSPFLVSVFFFPPPLSFFFFFSWAIEACVSVFVLQLSFFFFVQSRIKAKPWIFSPFVCLFVAGSLRRSPPQKKHQNVKKSNHNITQSFFFFLFGCCLGLVQYKIAFFRLLFWSSHLSLLSLFPGSCSVQKLLADVLVLFFFIENARSE